MIVQTKGFQIDGFQIPPFDLKEGEMIVLCLGNSIEASRLKEKLFLLFSGKQKHPKLILNEKLDMVEKIFLKGIKESLLPTTVKKYVQKKSLTPHKTLEKLSQHERISLNAKINHLPATARKLISLSITFSKSKKFIFDLGGLDPMGSKKVFDEVLKEIDNERSAVILLDSFPDFEKKCTKFIKIEK